MKAHLLVAAACLSAAFCFAQTPGGPNATVGLEISDAKVSNPILPGKETASIALTMVVQNDGPQELTLGLGSFDYRVQDASGNILKEVVPPAAGAAVVVKPKRSKIFKTNLHLAGAVPKVGPTFTLVVKAKDFPIGGSKEFRFTH